MSVNEDRIREFAYQIWESEGRPSGQEARHWDMACKLAAAEGARGAGTAKPKAPRKPKAAALQGAREVNLVAQDLTYYGIDLYGKRKLDELLRKLSDVNGIEWIRLQYAYPSGFPMDILDAMNERSNICNYLDMPLQHISDNMLRSMRRGTTKQKTIDLVDRIRDKVPEIAMRTTLICGYPGETEQDFEEMKQWVAETKFDRLGCFTYSHEEKTHAHNLIDDVPEEVKQARVEEIMEIQQGISYDINQEKTGKTFKVLIDKMEGDYFIGRTEFDSPEVDNEVLISKEGLYLSPGRFVNIQIDRAEDFDLYGSIVK